MVEPIIVISDSDLKGNGGSIRLNERVAYNANQLDALGGKKLRGGSAILVYPVTAAQIASGQFSLADGGDVLDITSVGIDRARMGGNFAIPMYGIVTEIPDLPIIIASPSVSPTEGSELITNSTFSSWSGDNPTGYTTTETLPNSEVSEVGTGEGHGGAGTGRCNLYTNGAAEGKIEQAVASVGFHVLRVVVDTHTSGPGLIAYLGGASLNSGSVFSTPFTASVRLAYWATNAGVFVYRTTPANDTTLTSFSVKKFTLASVFGDVNDPGYNNREVSIEIDTTPGGAQAGVVVCLDSESSPANFILGTHDGGRVRLDKVVAGTRTSLIDTAVAFSASAELAVIKDGTSVKLYYNGVQRGTTQTVSDAGIISNTKHGAFSLDSGIGLSNLTIQAVT